MTLDNSGAAATITDSGGTQTIATSLQLNSPLTLTVVNAADTLNLTGNIFNIPTGGGAALTMSGAGTVALSGVNTFSAGVTINSGTVSIGAAAALPAGASVVNNGALVIRAGTRAAPVVAGQISGSGSLTAGTLSSSAFLQLASGSGILSEWC